MATKPLQDEPSGPDTGYSENDNVEELRPVLVLRTAKSLILPLRIPDQWEEQPGASGRTDKVDSESSFAESSGGGCSDISSIKVPLRQKRMHQFHQFQKFGKIVKRSEI
jgi:hypothetical protein